VGPKGGTPKQLVDDIQARGLKSPASVTPEEARFAHVEKAAPDGPYRIVDVPIEELKSGGKGPPSPPRAAQVVDPSDFLRRAREGALHGERMDESLLRFHEAAITNETRRARILRDEGNRLLSEAGLGKKMMGTVAPREDDIAVLDDLYEALHGASRVERGELTVPPRLRSTYDNLRKLTDWEEAARIDFDPKMATVEDYFYRGWKAPREVPTRAEGGVALGGKPGFKHPRVEPSYREMRDAGFEPLFWNPNEQWMVSRLQGVRYRQQMELIAGLKNVGDDAIRPHAGGPIPQGWRTPQIGHAFEGKPFAYTDSAGEIRTMFTRRWIVRDEIANVLENAYGVRPNMGKVHVGGRTLDLTTAVDWATFTPKRAKLIVSLFQDADFLARSGVGGFSHAVDALAAGKPIEAAQAIIRLPKTAAEILYARVSPSRRAWLRASFDDTTPILRDRPGVNMKAISEAGLSYRDVTLLPADLDEILREVGQQAGLRGQAKNVLRVVGQVEREWRAGLFEGTYPASIMTDVKHNITPMMARMYPDLTDAQLVSRIAEQANKKWSVIPSSMSVVQNRFVRNFLTRFLFSMGENEGLLRQAIGVMKGPNKRFWATHWAGAYLFLISVANAIHFMTTGKALPTDRYSPISTDSWGPLPFGYNRDFASPNIPFTDRSGAQLMLDTVMQLDTAFRVLDPISFLTSRESVPVRAITNQISGTDFMDQPIDDVGPGGIVSRTAQAIEDTVAPIGLGPLVSRGIAAALPEGERILPPSEPRIGVGGEGIQATGLNVRARTTGALLDDAAREWTRETNEGERAYDDLNYVEKQVFRDELPENLQEELRQRTEESALRGWKPSIYYLRLEDLREEQMLREVDLLVGFFGSGPNGGENLRWTVDKRGKENSHLQRFWDGFWERKKTIETEIRRSKSDARVTILGDEAEKELERPDDSEPLAQALYDYWQLAEKATVNENFEIEVWVAEFEKLRKTWTPEQKAYIEEYRSLREHAPGMKEIDDALDWYFDEAVWGDTNRLKRGESEQRRNGFYARLNAIWVKYHVQWEAMLEGAGVNEAVPQPAPAPVATPIPQTFTLEEWQQMSRAERAEARR